MSLQLFAHPFSSYCQKVLIPLYENDIPFEWRMLSPEHPDNGAEHAALWPLQRMPLLLDSGRPVMEATIIVEHLQVHHPGPVRLIPDNPRAALDVRFMDRFFDNYVMAPMTAIVFNSIRPADSRDPFGVDQARALLDTSYQWLDARMAEREWAAGGFSLADCAAAPSLFYADWVHPLGDRYGNVRRYRQRLLARPSYKRAVDEARPYRAIFPLGAPDRD